MVLSLEEYYDLVFWINYVVYLAYFLIKYVLAPIVWAVLEYADRKKKKSSCLSNFAQLTQWFVLLIFGKQLAVKQLHERDDNNVPTFTLRKRRLSYGATMVLFVLILSFFVLAVGSALDLTLLFVTHICTEDPNIDCYPQLISGANDTGLNITIDEPIQDCSFWNSEGVSNRVTFVCYQFVFNVELFLAVIGGLLAFFIYAIKTTIGVFMFLTVCCLGVCIDDSEDKKGCTCRRCWCVNRIVLAILVSVIEIVLAIVCLVLGATGSTVDNSQDTPELIFVATHGAEVLVVFGIIATLFWLPWEDYTRSYKNGSSKEEHEMKRKR